MGERVNRDLTQPSTKAPPTTSPGPILPRLTPEQLTHAFGYILQLANVDAIFTRVLGAVQP
jgi:hypothetical protein